MIRDGSRSAHYGKGYSKRKMVESWAIKGNADDPDDSVYFGASIVAGLFRREVNR